MLDAIDNTAYAYHVNGNLFYSYTFSGLPSGTVTRIDFDTNNLLLSADETILDRCIDSDNSIYDLVSGSSYITKDDVDFYSSSGVTNIKVDSLSNLWILKDNNGVYKIDSDGSVVTNTTVGNSVVGDRDIFFSSEYNDDISDYADYVWVLQGATNILYKLSSSCDLLKTIYLEDGVDLLDPKFSSQVRENMVFDINGDSNAYDWQVKYADKTPRIEAQIFVSELSGCRGIGFFEIEEDFVINCVESPLPYITLSYPCSSLLDDEYYNFAFTYDSDNAEAKFYVNSVLVDEFSSTLDSEVYYQYENSMVLGGNMGNGGVLNDDLKMNKYTFKGSIADLRIYDRILNNFDIKHIDLTNYDYSDMVWNMPIGEQSFIEEVERFFKHKLPGSKSNFYNIRLNGLSITNSETRSIIEEIIKTTVKKIAPAYTQLYSIIWD